MYSIVNTVGALIESFYRLIRAWYLVPGTGFGIIVVWTWNALVDEASGRHDGGRQPSALLIFSRNTSGFPCPLRVTSDTITPPPSISRGDLSKLALCQVYQAKVQGYASVYGHIRLRPYMT